MQWPSARPQSSTRSLAIIGLAGMSLIAACVPDPGVPATSSTTTTAETTTTTEAPATSISVDGVELSWAYSRYAHYGVFGQWRQWTVGDDVRLSVADGQAVSGVTDDAGTLFISGNFTGGSGELDADTGAGTITWNSGDWVLNAYPSEYGAPDETYSDPILTIDEDGSGTLSMEVFLPEHVDTMYNTGTVPAVGPARVTVATFSSVSDRTDTGFTVTPDYTGRVYPSTVEEAPFQSCEGVGGSWPADFIQFLSASVRAHYYTTGCYGLNLTKAPLPFTIDWSAEAPTIVRQPSIVTNLLGGANLGLSVETTGSPTPNFQWQRSFDDGATWTDVAGGVGPKYPFGARPSDDGAKFRVIATNESGTVTSEATETTNVTYTPATINGQIADSTSARGTQAIFDVNVSGAPFPTVKWLRSDDNGATWQPAQGTLYQNGTRLWINPIELSDEGSLIKAQVSNSDDVVLESNAAAIRLLPVISTHPTDQVRWDNAPFTFVTTLSPTPTPDVQWEYSTDGGTTWADWIAESSNPQIAGNERRLLIPAPQVSMSGYKFRLRATTPDDVSYSDAATLTVIGQVGGPEVHITNPTTAIDTTVDTRVDIMAAGFGGATENIRLVIIEQSVWQPGQPSPTSGWVMTRNITPTSLTTNVGTYSGLVGVIGAGQLDPTKTYGVATFSINETNRAYDTFTPLTLVQP